MIFWGVPWNSKSRAALDSQVWEIEGLKFFSPQISFKTVHPPAFQPDRSRPFHIPGAGAGPERFNLNLLIPEFPPGRKVFDPDPEGGNVRPRVGQLQGPLKVRLVPGSIGLEIQVHVSPGFFHHSREKSGEEPLFLRLALKGNPQRTGRVKPGRNPGGKGEPEVPFQRTVIKQGEGNISLQPFSAPDKIQVSLVDPRIDHPLVSLPAQISPGDFPSARQVEAKIGQQTPLSFSPRPRLPEGIPPAGTAAGGQD